MDCNLHALLAEMLIQKNGFSFIYELHLTLYEKLALELEFGKEVQTVLNVNLLIIL
jgi:hypothetical protein